MLSSAPSFQFAHIEGDGCDVQFHPGGKVFATCGADTLVRLFDSADVSTSPIDVTLHGGPVNCVAFSKKGDRFATASDDPSTSISVFSYPRWEENLVLCNFTLPARSVCFHPEGGIAAGGDDGIIKFYPIAAEGQVPYVLKGHEGSILHMTFDHFGHYLASSSSDGSLRIWKVPQLESSDEPTCVLKKDIFQKSNAITKNHFKISWGKEGDNIAVPDGNKVSIFARDTWELLFSLTDGHQKEVTGAFWSPNYKYLCSVGVDGSIVVWDVQLREVMRKFTHSTAISSVSWDPKSNAVAIIDYEGQFSLWSGVIPTGRIGPHEMDEYEYNDTFDVLSEEENHEKRPAVSIFLDDEALSEDHQEKKDKQPSKPVATSKKEKQQKLQFTTNQTTGNDEIDHEQSGDEDDLNDDSAVQSAQSHLQAPFQPGSTPSEDKRRFLACNMVGLIISREEASSSSVEIEFHDTEENKPVRFTDRYRFSMASLGEIGAAFASSEEGDIPSTLYYRPFNTWTHNSEWTIQLPIGEEVRALCVGLKWTAVCTSKQYIRIFTYSGIQRYVFSLSGPIVSMAGKDNKLFIAYHTSEGFYETQDQHIGYILLDVEECQQTQNGFISISVGSELKWIGFTEGGMLATYDSDYVLRILAPIFGSKWVPVLDFQSRKKSKDIHFIVGILDDKVLSYACKNGKEYPATLPRPIIQTTPMCIPLLLPDHSSTKHEDAFLRHELNYKFLMKSLEEEDEDEDTLREVATKIQKTKALMDAEVLKMIEASCKSERGLKSLDLANLLHLKKAIDSAISIAESFRQFNLVERMKLIAAANEDNFTHAQPIIKSKKSNVRERAPSRDSDDDAVDEGDYRPTKQTRLADSIPSLSHYAPSEKSSVMSFDLSSQPTIHDSPLAPAPSKVPLPNPFSKKTPATPTVAPAAESKANIFDSLNQLADKGAPKKDVSTRPGNQPASSPFKTTKK